MQEIANSSLNTACAEASTRAYQESCCATSGPISHQLERYSMQYRCLGTAIIINNKKFEPRVMLNDREGTDIDATNLYRCFGQMGFKSISFKNNLKCADIRKTLEDAADADHTNHAMFACAILSHGEMGTIYGTDGTMRLQEIFDIVKRGNFNGLEGKPKMFIIQACRGSGLDKGTIVTDAVSTEPLTASYSVPTERDFLVIYSSTPGYYSWRNNKTGSLFISILSEELSQRCRDTEVMKILTSVNRKMAVEFCSKQTRDKTTSGMKQMPCTTTMLTKQLFFNVDRR